MHAPFKRLAEYTPPIHRVLPLPALALASVVAKDGSCVYASSDTFFKGAIFGRDSLEVADDLMDIKPALVHNILLTMGRLQGLETKILNEEQPGKIIHEYRTTELSGKSIDATSMKIFQQLIAKWGGNDRELAYYGSVDATPHFLRTLGTYCERHGYGILDETVVQRDGQQIPLRQAAQAATDWLLRQLQASQSGMLEYQMTHAQGTPNQVWKDSEESYVHENGAMANHDKPIASIEVQGLAYDALISAAALFPDEAKEYIRLAHQLRDITLTTLWQADRSYFGVGIDYSPQDELRVIGTTMANPAALLDTGFFDDLPAAISEQYVSAIVERVFAQDFLTSAGIRSRSLDRSQLVSFWDYHGSYVTWPKETYDIAKGLRRQRLPKLARQLENRLLNLVLKTREYPEFVYVDGWGRVLAGPPSQQPKHGKVVPVEGHDTPERIQAWTVSALLAIVSSRGQARLLKKPTTATSQQPWQAELEQRVAARIPRITVHLNPLKLWLQYPTHRYHLTRSKDTRAI